MFKVIETDPAEFCIVGPETDIHHGESFFRTLRPV
jgi:hypothetical protein